MKGPAYAPMPNTAADEGGMSAGSEPDSLLAMLSSSPAPSNMSLSQSETYVDGGNDSSSDYYFDAHFAKVVNITSFTAYGLIISIGLVGNLVVIFSILRTYRRISFTSMMLCSLAVADLLFSAVFVPIELYTKYHSNFGFGFFGCYALSFLWFLAPATSATMLLVISAERYIVIIHPLQAKVLLTKKMGFVIVNVTWLIAILLSLVSVAFTKYREGMYEDGELFQTCNRSTDKHTSKMLKISFFIGALYALPLLGMLFCNIRVIITLYRSSRVTRSMQSVMKGYSNGVNRGSTTSGAYSAGRLSCGMESEISTVVSHGGAISNGPTTGDSTKGGGKRKNRMHTTLQERKRVMVLLGILVVTYACLWGPLMILMVVNLHVDIEHTTGSLLSIAFQLLAMSNSAFNPIIYALLSRSFRKTIKTAFTMCCHRIPPPRLQWRSCRFTSTRDRGSSLSNSRDATQMTQYSTRSINNADSLKRVNSNNPNGYIYLRNNNVH